MKPVCSAIKWKYLVSVISLFTTKKINLKKKKKSPNSIIVFMGKKRNIITIVLDFQINQKFIRWFKDMSNKR